MTARQTIHGLKKLKKTVFADGKVDWEETDRLLEAIRPLAARYGVLFQDYERLLEKCREDGCITGEESAKLALQLDLLCKTITSSRLKFWLAVMVAALLAISAIAIWQRLSDVPFGGRGEGAPVELAE